MAEKWTPDPELAKLIAYANTGISRVLLAALLLKIALDQSNQMASIKAIETLSMMGADEGGGQSEEIDPQQALRLAELIDRFISGDSDIYTILANIEPTETGDNSGDGLPKLPGLRQNDRP